MSDVIVIGVAGGTGSGKTTLVKALMNRFGDNISVLSHDNYYKRHDEMSYEERTHLNYDCPDAFDTDMMIEHLRMLKNGQAIDCPTYDYTIHNRADEVLHVEPRRVIVVEGIMIFVDKTLCDEHPHLRRRRRRRAPVPPHPPRRQKARPQHRFRH